VQGMPIGTNLVSVVMPANSALITQFRKAKVMTAFAQAQLLQFKLTQTAELLPSLVNCVSSVKKNGIASAGGGFDLPAWETVSRHTAFLEVPGVPQSVTEKQSAFAGFANGLKSIHFPSWPGLSRPSTSLLAARLEDVDARHKAGHDE
jgi:hypothetical protein